MSSLAFSWAVSLMRRDDQTRFRATILALADGRLPDDVSPDSQQARDYRRMIAVSDEAIAKAPPLTPATKAAILAILRHGGGGSDGA